VSTEPEKVFFAFSNLSNFHTTLFLPF